MRRMHPPNEYAICLLRLDLMLNAIDEAEKLARLTAGSGVPTSTATMPINVDTAPKPAPVAKPAPELPPDADAKLVSELVDALKTKTGKEAWEKPILKSVKVAQEVVAEEEQIKAALNRQKHRLSQDAEFIASSAISLEKNGVDVEQLVKGNVARKAKTKKDPQ